MQIDLSSATHPLTFAAGQSFNEIFGTVGSGPNDVIPTGFQLFFNQSGGLDAAPVIVYIDNVRTIVPEPTSVVLIGVGAIMLSLGVRRRTR